MTLFVYILASKPQGTLYVGVTNDLVRRVSEHKRGLVPGFTKRYGVDKLVYFEEHGTTTWLSLAKKSSSAGVATGSDR